MISYLDLIKQLQIDRKHVVSIILQAHQNSLSSDEPEQLCSVVAIDQEDGRLISTELETDEQPDHWYVLAAYPHINPIEAVVLYADEKAAILQQWCLDQGAAPPEQDESEGDVPYLRRMVDWVANNMATTAGDVLIELAREQLLEDFDPERELDEALDNLQDLAHGKEPRHLVVDEDEDEGVESK